MPGPSTSPRANADTSHGETTLAPSRLDAGNDKAIGETRLPALTILWHPDRSRAGERALLAAPSDGRVELGRTTPAFTDIATASDRGRPIEDRHLSRQPLQLVVGAPDGSITVRRAGSSTVVEIDGEALDQERLLPIDAIERGVTLVLGRTVTVLLHLDSASAGGEPVDGMIGASAAMRRLRQEIRIAARLDVPVLLRGESGTGKELVARAIHEASRRADQPYLAVNLAAVPATLAASELFGVAKGAFTGATTAKDGFFQRASGGTLFLDEIGETPDPVQPLLLRALEQGEIQGVGHAEPRQIDVRLIAATDADLEAQIAAGAFRAPLLHRLAGYPIRLPPLRERRADLGRLLVAFLRQELDALDAGRDLDDPSSDWPNAGLVARLAAHAWPGNVRQLKNVARLLAIARVTGNAPRLDLDLGDGGEPTPVPPSADRPIPHTADAPPRGWRPVYRKPSEIDEDELLDALRANRFEPKATARALGVSRPSLYALIDAHPRLRKASELGADEIRAALDAHDGDLETTALALEVSAPALRQRCRALDLP